MNTSMKIGEAIRKQRKVQGLTLSELGKRMGISGSLVGQYERGVVNPKYETVIRFADALGVEPRELLGNSFSEVVSQEIERLSQNCGKADEIRLYHSGEVVKVTAQERLLESFDKLNYDGKNVAVERVKELAQLPQYQKNAEEDAQTTPGKVLPPAE